MAADRIKYSDIFDPKALDTAIAEVKRLQEELEAASKELKEMVKVSSELAKISNKTFDNADNIREVEKAIEDVKKQTSQLDAVERKRLKLIEQEKELNDERTKQNIKLAEELKARRKVLRDEAKATLEAGNAYRVLTRETNAARDNFKKLAAQHGLNSKQAKEARKEFERLDDQLRAVNDAAKDGRRDVGRYRIALDKLDSTLAKIGAATGVVAVLSKIFEGFSNVMGNNSQASATLEKALGAITVTFTVLLSRLTKAFPVFQRIAKSFFDSISDSIDSLGVKFEILALKATNFLGRNDDEIAKLNKSLETLGNQATDTSKDYEELAKIFEGTAEEIENTIKQNNRLIDTTLQYRREIIALEKQINSQLHAQAQLQAAADNENNSLLERIEYQKALIAQTELISSVELEIAEKREELARQNAQIFKDSLDAQEALQQATSERIALEIQQEQELLAQRTEQQTLEADELEQRLDFLIDYFDNKRTLNDKDVENEEMTFERRQQIAEENERLANESFEAQVQLFNDRLAAQGKAQLDIESLVNESDSRIVAQQALNAGLSERLTNRLLEVLRERGIVTSEVVEQQRELNSAEEEAFYIQEETAATMRAVNELRQEGVDVERVLSDLEDERLQQTINNLRIQISFLEEGSQERINLEKELSDALLEEQQRLEEEQRKAAEEAAQRRIEIQEAAASTIERLVQKSFEKRLEKIDELVDAEKAREDELRELARQGVQDADENLANAQKRRAELERQREAELRRQRTFELGLAAARAYSANVAANEPNPLAKTITDVTLLEAFIDSLAGFYEGTELVKDDLTQTVPGKDGYVIRVDGDERILNPMQNAMLPKNLSNWELVRLANTANLPEKPESSNVALIHGLKEVKSAIERKPSYIGRDYDPTEKAVIDTFVQRGKKLRKHYKKRGGLISGK